MSEIKSQNVNLGEGVDVRNAHLNNIAVGNSTKIRDYSIIFGSEENQAKIGEDCYIGPYCYLQGFHGLEIGNRVSFASGVMIFSDSGPNHGKLLEVYPVKKGRVTIGDDTWIGAGAKILPGVTIGERCIVAANSVVSRNVPNDMVVGGVPAKIIKKLVFGDEKDFTFKPEKFFELDGFEHKALFDNLEYIWQVFPRIPTYIKNFLANIPKEDRILGKVDPRAILVGDDIFIGKGAKVEPTAYIKGPCIIGEDSIVSTGAYVRGDIITGKGCILGHAGEFKNAIMLDKSAAPHFNFVGDSVLGNRVNIGAGVVLANFRLDAKEVPIGKLSSETNKLGAILGDDVKIACNAVTEPGTLLGRGSWVMPTEYIRRGFYEAGERKVDLIKKL